MLKGNASIMQQWSIGKYQSSFPDLSNTSVLFKHYIMLRIYLVSGKKGGQYEYFLRRCCLDLLRILK